MELGNSKLVVGVILSFFFIFFIFLQSTKAGSIRLAGLEWGSGNRKQIETIKKRIVQTIFSAHTRKPEGKAKNTGLLKTGQKQKMKKMPQLVEWRGKIYDDDEMSRYYLKQRNINKRENDEKHARKRKIGNMHEWVLLCVCVCVSAVSSVCWGGEEQRNTFTIKWCWDLEMPSNSWRTLCV